MIQHYEVSFRVTESGDPAGGTATATGIAVDFQDGPLHGGEPTGAFVETLLCIARDRLAFYQTRGLVRQEGDRVTVTDAGMPLLDALLGELVPAELVAA